VSYSFPHQDPSFRDRYPQGTPQNPHVRELRGRTLVSSTITPWDIGHGRGTRQSDRDAVNAAGTPVPQQVGIEYSGSHGFGGYGEHVNPVPAPGQSYQAGHPLGRQFGGGGPYFPQDPTTNMGHAGTFPVWRAHENEIRRAAELRPVQATTSLYYRPRQTY